MPIHAMFVDEATFEKMWLRRVTMPSANIPLHAPCVAHLIALKLHAARSNPKRMNKDMADVLALLERNVGSITRDELDQICARYASPECVSMLREQHYL